jgi:hypothetical protein
MGGISAYLCRKKDVPQAIGIELFEIIIGEVQFEAAFEMPDAFCNFIPVEGGY